MVKEFVVLCDICKQVAYSKCFVCGKDICEVHNFGGRNAHIAIDVNINVSWGSNGLYVDDEFIDICPACKDKVADMMKCESSFLNKKLEEDLEKIKTWFLEEIKKDLKE